MDQRHLPKSITGLDVTSKIRVTLGSVTHLGTVLIAVGAHAVKRELNHRGLVKHEEDSVFSSDGY